MYELNSDDEKAIQALFDKLTGPQKPVLKTIASALIEDFRMGFKLSRDPSGKKWAPITHRPGKPLILNRILSNSLIDKVTEKEIEIGTNVKYAEVHQTGSMGMTKQHTKTITQAFGKKLSGGPKKVQVKSYKNNIKARPFLGITQRQRSIIERNVLKHLKKQSGGDISA